MTKFLNMATSFPPRFLLSASRGCYAGSENAGQFFGLGYEPTKFLIRKIAGFANDFEPNTRLRKLFCSDFEFVDKILSGFRLGRFGIVGSHTGGRPEQLISKTAASDFACRQSSADIHAAGRELNQPIFKFLFCHVQLFFSFCEAVGISLAMRRHALLGQYYHRAGKIAIMQLAISH